MSLPLKVQIGIRDYWAAESSPPQTSLKKLAAVLGQAVVVDPEWQLLLNELGELYSDKLGFVRAVAECVEVFANSVTELLEDEEAHEQWIETLLEKAKTRSQLRLFLETCKSTEPQVSWSDQRCAFVVQLPKKQVLFPSQLYPSFRGGLLECFGVGAKGTQTPAAADDWADVKVDKATGKPAVSEPPPTTTTSTTQRPAAAEYLPNWESLPRPDELLLKPPYHLILHAGVSQISIECSHSPSLKLLSDYLKRWCRVNHIDSRSPPAVDIRLQQSAFGLSEMFDRLELSTKENRYVAQFQVTTPMMLALIEGVLGYTMVSGEGGTWTFRRDMEFRWR